MRIAIIIIGNTRRNNYINGYNLRYGGGGASGTDTSSILIAEYLANQGHDVVVCTDRLDKPLEDELIKINPTHVISFIGRTHGFIEAGGYSINTIDYLEFPGKLTENIRDNLFSPLVLADTCKKMNIHYSYIGTGCIFCNDTLNLKDFDGFDGFSENSFSPLLNVVFSVFCK